MNFSHKTVKSSGLHALSDFRPLRTLGMELDIPYRNQIREIQRVEAYETRLFVDTKESLDPRRSPSCSIERRYLSPTLITLPDCHRLLPILDVCCSPETNQRSCNFPRTVLLNASLNSPMSNGATRTDRTTAVEGAKILGMKGKEKARKF